VNAPAITVAVPGLTHLEADELATTLRDAGADPDSDLDVQSEGGDGEDRYNEPFTLLAVMALSQITMTALAIYLSKERKRSTMKVYLRHRRPDGEEIDEAVARLRRLEQQLVAIVPSWSMAPVVAAIKRCAAPRSWSRSPSPPRSATCAASTIRGN
jgi:hypothetical protein